MLGGTAITSTNVRPKYPDDKFLVLGTDNDIVMLNRVATLTIDEELTNVIKGTSVHPATAANTLIISNITDDGDILALASDGGDSKAFLFFDASAPDLLLYNVGGTWTAGATTWTLPSFTLAGPLTLAGYALNAGSGDLKVTTTGADKGIEIVCTNDGVDGVFLMLHAISANPAVSDYIGKIRWVGVDGAGADNFLYGQIHTQITNIGDGTEASKYEVYLANAGGANLAMALFGAGELWVDTFVNPDDGVKVSGTQVVGTRVVDAAIDDAINASTWDSTTAGVLAACRDALVTHGLVAAS